MADHVTLRETSGQDHDVTFCMHTHVPRPDGGFDQVPVVAARVRFSPGMARAIVSGLSHHLAVVESRGQPRN